jgi:hypothetical protein
MKRRACGPSRRPAASRFVPDPDEAMFRRYLRMRQSTCVSITSSCYGTLRRFSRASSPKRSAHRRRTSGVPRRSNGLPTETSRPRVKLTGSATASCCVRPELEPATQTRAFGPSSGLKTSTSSRCVARQPSIRRCHSASRARRRQRAAGAPRSFQEAVASSLLSRASPTQS